MYNIIYTRRERTYHQQFAIVVELAVIKTINISINEVAIHTLAFLVVCIFFAIAAVQKVITGMDLGCVLCRNNNNN